MQWKEKKAESLWSLTATGYEQLKGPARSRHIFWPSSKSFYGGTISKFVLHCDWPVNKRSKKKQTKLFGMCWLKPISPSINILNLLPVVTEAGASVSGLKLAPVRLHGSTEHLWGGCSKIQDQWNGVSGLLHSVFLTSSRKSSSPPPPFLIFINFLQFIFLASFYFLLPFFYLSHLLFFHQNQTSFPSFSLSFASSAFSFSALSFPIFIITLSSPICFPAPLPVALT